MADDKATFSHLDEAGKARMVDVGNKPDTQRVAIAAGELHFSEPVLEMLQSGSSPKGDVFTLAKVAGIMAAKRTSDLIPLCHPLPLSFIDVTFQLFENNRVEVRAEARTAAKTGVEMEALTAASVALLTIYDMCKSVDRGMRIENIRLLRKEGGKSGLYEAPDS